MVKLREYQLNCIDTIVKTFKKSNRQLIQLPTGSGKTYIFLSYLSQFSKKSLIICPTMELIEQTKESANDFFHKSEVFAKNSRRMKTASHTIVTAACLNFPTAYEFLYQQKFDTIIIDEAHKAQCHTYVNFLDNYRIRNPNFNLIGFTATPERMDKKSLLDIFGSLSFDMNIYDLIEKGHLCDIEAYRIETGQKISTHIHNGDFRHVELKKLDNSTRNSLISKVIIKNCMDKPTIVFCIDIDHSDFLASELIKQGVKAKSIHGNLPFKERKKIIEDFKNGSINVLTNCQLLTEGFDAPCIENVVIARPTRSKSLYCQMIGRGIRNYPGKEICKLYELTDNNHKICTFNVLAGKENDFTIAYKQGSRLIEHKKELENINPDDLIIRKSKISLIEDNNFYAFNVMNHQIDYLNKNNINYLPPISYEEAAFLIWKDKLKEKYGNN